MWFKKRISTPYENAPWNELKILRGSRPSGNVSKEKLQDHKEELEIVLDTSVDEKNRRIYLMQDIDTDCTIFVVSAIQYLNRKGKKPIEVMINSGGGDLDDMFAMYDAFRTSKSAIHTIGTGHACSAAFVLLFSGDKRFATENCIAMHHDIKSGTYGDGREIKAAAKVHTMFSDMFYGLMEKHTSQDKEFWMNIAKEEGEYWMDTEKMIELGVIDGVYSQ